MDENFRLDNFRLDKVPPSLYYVPDFITAEEEQALLRNVYAAPKPKWTQLSNRRLQNWGGLPHPKGMVPEPMPEWLSRICERIGDTGAFEGANLRPNHVLVNEYLPGQGIMPHTDGPLYYPTVTTISLGDSLVLDFYRALNDAELDCCVENPGCCVDDPGHCLHSAACCAEETNNINVQSTDEPSASFTDRRFASILIQPRSLVVVKHDMYVKYLHGIADVASHVIDDQFVNLASCRDIELGARVKRTQPRISLTVRVVPKVLKNKLLLGRRK